MTILYPAALAATLVYCAYLSLAGNLVATIVYGLLLLGGTVLAILAVKRIGHYYQPHQVRGPRHTLYAWKELFGLQLIRWRENISDAEALFLGLLAAWAMILFGLFGFAAAVFFLYAYATVTFVCRAFHWQCVTFIAKDGIYRSTPHGLRLLAAWPDIIKVRLAPRWFIYCRVRGMRYYYFMPDRLMSVYKLIKKHEKQDKHHHS